ncbi:MAG: hypothetical protein M0R80_08845 [Proteobacteria bacterium]|jgi:predicted acylesterase/phospholipase RssA|nr:hypothetical protein [Pseudomonadota bacterium]
MIGFCFSGDGSRGAIQAGIALDLYQKHGIKADFVMGASSGSACSTGYAYAGPQGLVDMWNGVTTILSLFGFNWNFLWNRGIFNEKPAEKVVGKIVQQGPFCTGVVTRLNIVSGEIEYIWSTKVSREEFADAALGAVAIPGIVHDRNGWVDAGARQMAPLQQCIDAGCDEVYVILGRPLITPPWQYPTGLFAFGWMSWRAVDLSLYELLVRDIQGCLKKNADGVSRKIKIHVAEPNEWLYDSIFFRYCQRGVKYALDGNYVIKDEQALRMALL